MKQDEGKIFRYEFRVPDISVDENGHVNNVWYVRWMQDAAMRHSEARGSILAAKLHGAAWFVRSHHIDYFRPAFSGELLTVLTWLSQIHSVRCIRKYKFVREDALIARGETDWVFVDASNGSPIGIPEDIRKSFTLVPKHEEP